MSSLARRLERNQERKLAKKAERAQKKAGPAAAIGGLMQLQQQMAELSRIAPMLLPHLNQLRAVTAHLIEEQESIKYELARCRAVTMRFAVDRQFNKYVVGKDGIDDVIDAIGAAYADLEQQYRGEYDALAVLANLGSWSIRQAEAASAPKEPEQLSAPTETPVEETPQLEATG